MTCRFIFCLHNHQPVGNFDHIFEWAYQDCYNKTLDILIQYPEFRFAVHNSGPLLEWIKGHHPDYLHKLKTMVSRGQVEIIGGGFYEPIFSVISESDIRGQIGLMQEFCGKEFGVIPKGFWTAERVWDPDIPRLVSDFDLNYTILDDNHFRYAGIEEQYIHGYYITERLNHTLNVFPIDRYLRYSIPFRLPEETINYFRSKSESLEDAAFLYGDDGEKFGVWSGTYKWVFEEKWLINFVEEILKNPWIKMTHPSEYLAAASPKGRVYLTQGSYYELSEWALPPRVARKLVAIHKELNESGREGEFYPFIKGGVWNNFLNKYPESNAINKRTLLLSREITALEREKGDDFPEMKRELYRGECNCAYWHGLFGGIYLNSLRHALHHHTLLAEKMLLDRMESKKINIREEDFWNEGHSQILIRGSHQSVIAVPYLGGAISELGIYSGGYNVLNVMTRREEAYHEMLRHVNEEENGQDEVKSIHDMVRVKENGLPNYLVYDASRRYSFKEVIAERVLGAEDLMFRKVDILECGDYSYDHTMETTDGEVSITFRREFPFGNERIGISKELRLGADSRGLDMHYSVEGVGALPVYLGVELNVNLLGSHDEDRYYLIPGVERAESYTDSMGCSDKVSSFKIADESADIFIEVISTREFSLVRYPVYTVSQSDSGFEKNYQGSCLVLFFKLAEKYEQFDVKIAY